MTFALRGPAGADGDDGADAPIYNITSDSEFDIAFSVVGTTLNFNPGPVQHAYQVGNRVRVSSAGDPTIFVEGLITTVGTGSIVVTVDRIGTPADDVGDWVFAPAGEPGNKWSFGSGAPDNDDGNNGDIYVDTASSFYTTYVKTAGVWS